MKKLVRLAIGVIIVLLLVKLCSGNLGSVISLPGGTGESSSTEESGGWFGQKKNDPATENDDIDKSLKDISKELERKLGIGKKDQSSTSSTTTTVSSDNPLSFKGIPITGTSSEFGTKLVRAGFRNSGNGVYVGDFAGYGNCKVTLVGNNPVTGVRVDFPTISDWDSLEKSYDNLQASLTQKYGIEPKVSSGSNVATYSLPNGTITLDADVKEQSSWHVILKYSNQAVASLPVPTGSNPIDDL